ncbi:hypothetical protein [Corynebacterium frankenforstense]|uniref:hypothetical protein n=1 Tax=Corynebacterium frankenforstense TaxID=1230998 RepID=UPI00254EC173|nr:hypothetical protein [Corynebacterium frankenforstense]MDK6260409.1 hypothetical protein [Corynebacterium frankenforstense]
MSKGVMKPAELIRRLEAILERHREALATLERFEADLWGMLDVCDFTDSENQLRYPELWDHGLSDQKLEPVGDTISLIRDEIRDIEEKFIFEAKVAALRESQ